MIHIFVYPVDGFDRNITDDSLIKAKLNGKSVERYSLEEFIEALNDDVINLDTHWVKMTDDTRGYPISHLHPDDLEELGFDTGNVSCDEMLEIAERMNETYRELSYWICLKAIAEDLGIKKIRAKKQKNNNP